MDVEYDGSHLNAYHIGEEFRSWLNTGCRWRKHSEVTTMVTVRVNINEVTIERVLPSIQIAVGA